MKMKEEVNANAGVVVQFGWKDGLPVSVELKKEDRPNMIIHGQAGSGKTTMLQNIVTNLNAMYKPGAININIIDDATMPSWANYVMSNRQTVNGKIVDVCTRYFKANPSLGYTTDMFDYYTSMAEFRAKSRISSTKDSDEYCIWVEDNNSDPVVIIVDEYQRFIDTKSEKSFVRMVKAIYEFGAETDMHLIMASQSSKGTKVALGPNIWNSFKINIALKNDPEFIYSTFNKYLDFGNEKYTGYYLEYGKEEPTKFTINKPDTGGYVSLID